MFTPRLTALVKRLPELGACRTSIADTYDTLHHCFASSGRILLCGNGGGPADADHWAGELLKGFGQKRSLPAELRKTLPSSLARPLQGALRFLSPAFPLSAAPSVTMWLPSLYSLNSPLPSADRATCSSH